MVSAMSLSGREPKAIRQLETREQAIVLYKLYRQMEIDEYKSWNDLLLQRKLVDGPIVFYEAMVENFTFISDKLL